MMVRVRVVRLSCCVSFLIVALLSGAPRCLAEHGARSDRESGSNQMVRGRAPRRCGTSKRSERRYRKLAASKHVMHGRYAEIEVALCDALTRRQLADLPRAPGSVLRCLDGTRRFRAQLPAPIVGDLIERGIEVTVVRDFMVWENSDALGRAVLGNAMAQCSGAFVQGGNEVDYPIPESEWVCSEATVDGAASNAVVTCVDVHFEIVHPRAGDLWIDLSDEDLTTEHTLRYVTGNSTDRLVQTVTGITEFAGEGVNQAWGLWVMDVMPGQRGYIDRWWIKVYYEIPDQVCPHDEWDDPVVVREGQVYRGVTVGATGDYETECGFHDALDVWHVYTPSRAGVVTVRAEGDDFDTTLAVFDPCGVEGVCNDDGCEGVGSVVTMQVEAEREYRIRVAGYDYGTGAYVLTVRQHVSGAPPAADGPWPANGALVTDLPVVLSWDSPGLSANGLNLNSLSAGSGPGERLQPKTIYGFDDRFEDYHVADARVRAVGEATALLVHRGDLWGRGDGTYELQTESFADAYERVDPIGSEQPLCEDEPFRSQPSVGMCTAVLVAPDMVATTGHCVACGVASDIVVMFGFVMLDADTPAVVVDADDVYPISEVVSFQIGHPDWALARLERAVVGRTPLPLRRVGRVADKQRLVAVGHPWGMPMKYDAGAVVRQNSAPTFFQANVDSSRGSSGSPVVNAESMTVEGLLTGGQQEFVSDVIQGCDRSWVCPDSGCIVNGQAYWESVVRATTFSAVVPSFDLYLGADPDHLELVATGLATPRFAPPSVRESAVYYWRVVARNIWGQSEGPLWSFRVSLGLGASGP